MRSLFAFLACLMLVATAWSSAAQAQRGIGCGDTVAQKVASVAGDCDEAPADSDNHCPRCHADCHGHHVAVALSGDAPGRLFDGNGLYAPAAAVTWSAHRNAGTLRPPQA